MLNIQRVKTDWSKEARGNKKARVRNAYPEVALIGETGDTGGAEWYDICQKITFESYSPDDDGVYRIDHEYNNMLAVQEGETVKISLTSAAGFRYHLFTLAPRQWIRIKYNGIYSTDYTWRYYKTSLNIYNGNPADLSPDYFITAEPAGIFSKRIWTSKKNRK
ncbi:hypothetical protein ACTHGU_20020 [Chitinophagaceae bacterium MMS25-I14]